MKEVLRFSALVVVACAALATARSVEAQNVRYAAVAVSIHPLKDAVGWEYRKDTAHGAETAATAFCERRFVAYGIADGRCAVASGTAYVIGLYCSDKTNVSVGIGVGNTPIEAARAALKQAGDFPLRYCMFVGFRHATIDRVVIVTSHWTAICGNGGPARTATSSTGHVQANDRPERSAALVALNSVLRRCGDVTAEVFRLTDFRMATN